MLGPDMAPESYPLASHWPNKLTVLSHSTHLNTWVPKSVLPTSTEGRGSVSTNAFAVVCLQTVQEFHLCRLNTNAPDCPY